MQTSGVHYLLQKEYLEKPKMRTFYQMAKNQMHKKNNQDLLMGSTKRKMGFLLDP